MATTTQPVSAETTKQLIKYRTDSGVAVMSLFGMMNWIYTWHKPRVDQGAATLAREMGNIFLRGVLRPAHKNGTQKNGSHKNGTHRKASRKKS